MSLNIQIDSAVALLQSLIETQSFSSEEDGTALLIVNWLEEKGITLSRKRNNIYAFNKHYDASKPLLLLNSHHDTVKPNKGYTRDPYNAEIKDGKLYGLGSNDAGASLVGLLTAFVHFYEREDLSHNIVIVASAEEESSGPNGLNSMLAHLPEIDVAIVGEPTLMNLAIAEKGLVVFDAVVKGTAGHAAHIKENMAIYNVIETLQWFENITFDKVSETLGATKVTVTQINAGSQHNVVPSQVELVIDVRVNEHYSNQEIADYMVANVPCNSIQPRSLRLNSSRIPKEHKLVQAGITLGRETYGSPTLSDQSCLSCPSLKLGIGDSTRSHMADEFVYIHEIEEGIALYIELLEKFLTA
ncbi:M20 family metallo-hydrolase [Dokdonia donghaensis]|uniref:Acetylornithine deacetylase n=1 Tax=Dokdonia donghaensis DSW-1 TaxID=1300343 RepID=A0A0A2GY05_9FLAO|nr:M20 family metallo-hydrolase [Dokdonia donghaensis]ANH60080.1 Succinyl-diaminopimelate desuccinylase [Dokdonia donghaensis DSW-1]KGO07383.1 acetylornithine deacetylase [Dokdonia donghaensis DSW-1]